MGGVLEAGWSGRRFSQVCGCVVRAKAVSPLRSATAVQDALFRERRLTEHAMKEDNSTDTSNKAGDSRPEAERRHLFGHGRLSYIQIPAIDVRKSAQFYASVFGWEVRGGSDDHLSFTDATGHMIGAWVTGRALSREPGILPHIYVHGIDAVIERIRSSGGEIVKPVYPEGDLWVATFRDPAGNVIGIWQQGPR